MGRIKLAGAFMLLVLVSVGSCSDPTTVDTQRRSSSSSGSSGSDPDGGQEAEPSYVLDDGSGSGTTWSELYADFFGPSGRASCAGTGTSCHASQRSEGYARSMFLCTDEASCLQSMKGASNLIKSSNFAEPENAFLIGVLRKSKADGSIVGTQPKSPLFVFHANSIERIKTWIGAGASP
jgi:hypothetical protein